MRNLKKKKKAYSVWFWFSQAFHPNSLCISDLNGSPPVLCPENTHGLVSFPVIDAVSVDTVDMQQSLGFLSRLGSLHGDMVQMPQAHPQRIEVKAVT